MYVFRLILLLPKILFYFTRVFEICWELANSNMRNPIQSVTKILMLFWFINNTIFYYPQNKNIISLYSPFPHICRSKSEFSQFFHVKLLSSVQHWVAFTHVVICFFSIIWRKAFYVNIVLFPQRYFFTVSYDSFLIVML